MKRYLLFDSGCCKCSKIAESIEQEAGGKLTIRSLRDPAVKELLDRERPGWKWEPMLVEEKADKVRVFAGGAMSRRLLVVLGPRRALRVIQMVTTVEKQNQAVVDTDRRAFLRQGAILLAVGALFPGLMKDIIWKSNALAAQSGNKTHTSSEATGVIPGTELNNDVKTRVRKAVAMDPAFQYMYIVSTGEDRLSIPKIMSHLEIVGYHEARDVYLVGLRFVPDGNEPKGLEYAPEKPALKTELRNDYHVLALAYSMSEKRSLSILEVYGVEFQDHVDIYSQRIDSRLIIRVQKDHPSEAQVVSNDPRNIQENIAKQVGYDYKSDPVLKSNRQTQLGTQSVEITEGNCEWICDLVSVVVCYLLPPPIDLFCGVFTVLECHEFCDPACVGEGCP